MIQLENITAGFGGQPVMQDFSLCLPESGVICLFGPSGSGKTTLLRILAGLHQDYSGTVRGLAGKKVSMVFQEHRLLPQCTALENIQAVLPRSRRSEALPLLKQLGLEQSAHKYPSQLSGGMNRRVAIGRALAYGGELYLLDEPFQGLDRAAEEQAVQAIRCGTAGSLVVLVTHSRESALRLADEVVVCAGSPMTVQRRFVLPQTQEGRQVEQLQQQYGDLF